MKLNELGVSERGLKGQGKGLGKESRTLVSAGVFGAMALLSGCSTKPYISSLAYSTGEVIVSGAKATGEIWELLSRLGPEKKLDKAQVTALLKDAYTELANSSLPLKSELVSASSEDISGRFNSNVNNFRKGISRVIASYCYQNISNDLSMKQLGVQGEFCSSWAKQLEIKSEEFIKIVAENVAYNKAEFKKYSEYTGTIHGYESRINKILTENTHVVAWQYNLPEVKLEIKGLQAKFTGVQIRPEFYSF